MYRLNERQAYEAVVLFLDRYYERGKPEDIKDLMGSIRPLWKGGIPGDPAQWYDWLGCVDKISPPGTSDEPVDFPPAPDEGPHRYQLDERQAFQAFILFLEQYNERGESDDIAALLGDLRSTWAASLTGGSALWSAWLECVGQALNS